MDDQELYSEENILGFVKPLPKVTKHFALSVPSITGNIERQKFVRMRRGSESTYTLPKWKKIFYGRGSLVAYTTTKIPMEEHGTITMLQDALTGPAALGILQ